MNLVLFFVDLKNSTLTPSNGKNKILKISPRLKTGEWINLWKDDKFKFYLHEEEPVTNWSELNNQSFDNIYAALHSDFYNKEATNLFDDFKKKFPNSQVFISGFSREDSSPIWRFFSDFRINKNKQIMLIGTITKYIRLLMLPNVHLLKNRIVARLLPLLVDLRGLREVEKHKISEYKEKILRDNETLDYYENPTPFSFYALLLDIQYLIFAGKIKKSRNDSEQLKTKLNEEALVFDRSIWDYKELAGLESVDDSRKLIELCGLAIDEKQNIIDGQLNTFLATIEEMDFQKGNFENASFENWFIELKDTLNRICEKIEEKITNEN